MRRIRAPLFFVICLAGPLMAATKSSVDLALEPWLAVNDGVMGGISAGEMVAIPMGLRFQGQLSLENNGGFASVRRSCDGVLRKATGVRLVVTGDGRPFQFRLRTDDRFDGVSWRAVFETDGSRQTIFLPLDSFESVFRGRNVAADSPLSAERIRQIGFLLADGADGPFQLDIWSIDFVAGSTD